MAHPPQSPGTAHHLRIRDERVVLRRRFTRRQDRIADAGLTGAR